jgi:hypothetical protein
MFGPSMDPISRGIVFRRHVESKLFVDIAESEVRNVKYDECEEIACVTL